MSHSLDRDAALRARARAVIPGGIWQSTQAMSAWLESTQES